MFCKFVNFLCAVEYLNMIWGLFVVVMGVGIAGVSGVALRVVGGLMIGVIKTF
jgi:hypothetical protein